jgi:hypothetical protein
MRRGDSAVRKVGLTFDGGSALGTVESALYDPDAGVDIAVVRMLDNLPHACLALSDDAGAEDDRLAYLGYSRETGPLRKINGRCTMRGTVSEGEDELIRLGDVDIPQGASGGPVLNLATGEVVGIVTRRIAGREGGLAASLLQLRGLIGTEGAGDLYHRLWRAHDLYHYDHYVSDGDEQDPRGAVSWTGVRTALARAARREAGVLTPARRTRMFGLLAGLEPPECSSAVIDVVKAVGGRGWSELTVSPHTWRDGTALLRDAEGRTQLEASLLYCAAVAEQDAAEDPAPREALARWVRDAVQDDALLERLRTDLERMRSWGEARRAARPREEQRDAGAEPGVAPAAPRRERLPLVRLEVHEIHWESDRFRWTLLGIGADGDTAFRDEDETGLRRDDLAERLARPLARAFHWADAPARPAALEALLPVGLFDLPVDDWIVGGPDRLGVQRPVTVRWGGRRSVPDPAWLQREHTSRWAGAAEGPLRLHPLYDDTGRVRTTLSRAQLTEAGRKAVPALCGPAEEQGCETVLLRVLHAGYGMAVWRRHRDWQYNWREFERNVKRTLGAVTRADTLPDELHRLRVLLNIPDPDALWAQDMILLFDPPGPGLPAGAEDEPLMEPQ